MPIDPVVSSSPGSIQGIAQSLGDLNRRVANLEATRTVIGNGTLTGGKIANGTITGTNVQAGSIDTPQLAAGSITAAQISAGAITAGAIAAGAVTAGTIAAGAITAGTIAAGAVTAATIAANTITATQIAAHTITATQIAAGTITANEITAHTITATQIAAGTITAIEINAHSITANEIAAHTITATEITANTITATQIAAGTITATEIAALTITGAKITAGTIDATKITVSTLSALSTNMGSLTAGTVTGATIQTAGSGARAVMDSSGLRGYALDGVTKTFEINSGSGIATLTGVVFAAAGSTIPGGTITGTGSLPPAVFPPLGGGNLLVNSSFEDQTSGVPNGMSFTQATGGSDTTAANVMIGTSALKITATGTAPVFFRTAATESRVVVGLSYTASVYMKAGSALAGRLFGIGINWYNAAGTFLSQGFGTQISGLTTTWQRPTFTATAPTNAAYAQPFMYGTGWTIGDVAYADGYQLEQGTVPTSYAPKADEILPGTIGTNEIAAGSITTSKMTANTINGDRIQTNTLDAGRIISNTIDTLQLKAGAVTTSVLAAGAVTAQKITLTLGSNNQIFNSSFEDTTGFYNGWASNSASAAAAETTIAHNGGTSAKLTASGALVGTRYGDTNNLRVPVQPNQLVTLSAWIYTATAGRTGRISVRAWTAMSGGTVTGTTITTGVALTQNAWTRVSGTYTVPASGVAAVGIGAFVENSAAAELAYFDDIQIEDGDVLTGYAPKADEVLPGSVGSTQITPNSITSANILANTIQASDIATGTITANEIAAATITGSKIAATTITASNLNVTTLSAITANLGTITAGTVTGATIQTAASGARVVMDSSNLSFFESGGARAVDISSGGQGLNLLSATSGTPVATREIIWKDSSTGNNAAMLSAYSVNGGTPVNNFTITAAPTTGMSNSVTISGTTTGGGFGNGLLSLTALENATGHQTTFQMASDPGTGFNVNGVSLATNQAAGAGSGHVTLLADNFWFSNQSMQAQLSVNRGSLGHLGTIGAGSTSANGNAAYLHYNGTWTNGSSETLKEAFEDLPDVLQRIARINVRKWNYRPAARDEVPRFSDKQYRAHVKMTRASKHIGPTAEDLYAEFPDLLGDEQRNVAPSDVAGLSLAGVRALIGEVKALRKRVGTLEAAA